MIVTNTKTGKTREVKITERAIKKAMFDGVDTCTGPCKCRVEPDGECPKGWPSKSLAAGVI